MTRLKPCPFCGGKGEAFEIRDGIMTVMCNRCYSQSRPYILGQHNMDDVIAAWNRRAPANTEDSDD